MGVSKKIWRQCSIDQPLSGIRAGRPKALGFIPAKRERTILRVAAGAGSVGNINWVLEQGYHYHGKSYGYISQALFESVEKGLLTQSSRIANLGWFGTFLDYTKLKLSLKRSRSNRGRLQFQQLSIGKEYSHNLALILQDHLVSTTESYYRYQAHY